MNFKMKALVAAAALTASMAANATITNNGSGDSSLVLTLIDNTNNISLSVDLGFSHTTFDRNSNFSWDITGASTGNAEYAAAWSSFWATADAQLVQWAVASADNTGTGVGARSLFTTKANVGVTTAINTTPFGTNLGNFDTYLNTVNNTVGHIGVTTGASVATAGNGFAENTFAYGTNGSYATMIGDTTGVLDTNLSVWLVNSGASSLTAVSQGQFKTAGFSNYFNMSSNGTLTYTAATVAAVPEADTSAMLLAGLALMGFIARRRTAA